MSSSAMNTSAMNTPPGAIDWNRGLQNAIKNGNIGFVRFFVNRGDKSSKNWEEAIRIAKALGHENIVEYLEENRS